MYHRKNVEERRRIEDASTIRQLVSTGNIPGAIRKGFRAAGTQFFGLSDDIRVKILGGGKLTAQERAKVGGFVGELGLFGGVSPFLASGVTSKEVAKQISKTRFDKLKDALAAAEREVAEKQTLKDQFKFLKGIKDKLKTDSQKRNFDLWVRSLAKKEIFVKPKIKIGESVQKTQQAVKEFVLEFNIEGIPSIGGVKVTQAFALSKIAQPTVKSITGIVKPLPKKSFPTKNRSTKTEATNNYRCYTN